MKSSYMKFIQNILLIFIFIVPYFSCKKYLDKSPNKSLTIPRSIKELQGLLDNDPMYSDYPIGGQIADDNYFFTNSNYNSVFFKQDRDSYIWDPNTDLTSDYSLAYKRIFLSNVVLNVLDTLNDFKATQEEYNNVKGSALFYRASNFYELAL